MRKVIQICKINRYNRQSSESEVERSEGGPSRYLLGEVGELTPYPRLASTSTKDDGCFGGLVQFTKTDTAFPFPAARPTPFIVKHARDLPCS